MVWRNSRLEDVACALGTSRQYMHAIYRRWDLASQLYYHQSRQMIQGDDAQGHEQMRGKRDPFRVNCHKSLDLSTVPKTP